MFTNYLDIIRSSFWEVIVTGERFFVVYPVSMFIISVIVVLLGLIFYLFFSFFLFIIIVVFMVFYFFFVSVRIVSIFVLLLCRLFGDRSFLLRGIFVLRNLGGPY